MSAQFGKYNFDGQPVRSEDLDPVRPILAPYGPDGPSHLQQDNLGILYRAFCTTKESRTEVQPHVCASGAVITWEGRLDNREDLLSHLRGDVSPGSTDLEIVAAAYENWRSECFGKLLGDWALSIVDPLEHAVILAKDFLGTRHLYYSIENHRLAWCTILDPLLLLPARTLALNEEYIAGWLSSFPAPHLTPYEGIRSVPPSSFIRITKEACRTCQYWDFDPAKRIRYRSDADYEEHFRNAFAQSVRRRLRSDSPVLAELSGGMDSSSIVCMGDRLISRGEGETQRIDTLSYYDDSEPNWDERPYFTQVEEQRGRKGCHIDISPLASWKLSTDDNRFKATPSSVSGSKNIADQFNACLVSQGNRVLLSGIGGDEVAGGVPTPAQELADLLRSCSIRVLAHRLRVWALAQRRPWFHLLAETIRLFLPSSLVPLPEYKRPPAWLSPEFILRHRAASTGYETRLRLSRSLPSFQDNLATLNALRRQFSCDNPVVDPAYETRYPFLDRDLLEFLFAIPREQLVRPGQRRSLMRRSLAGIVPSAVLNRRRKAYVARAPMTSLSEDASDLIRMSGQMASALFGFVDARAFSNVIQRAREGQMVLIVPLTRTLRLESWLRALRGPSQWASTRT